MDIEVGKHAIELTWQEDFPDTTFCACGGDARLAFSVMEDVEENYISELHKNTGKGGFWPDDAIAVAIYFCRDCFKSVVLWNQA